MKKLKVALITIFLTLGGIAAQATIYGFILSCGKEVYFETPENLSNEGIVAIMDILEAEYCAGESSAPGE